MPLAAFIVTLLSALLLAAHFLRSFIVLGMLCSLSLPFAFLVRKPWARRLLELGALVSATIWILTAIEIRAERLADAQPWVRMFAILAAVALFSLSSIPLLEGSRARLWFAGIRNKKDSSLE
ncbi:MAG TPA: hypothetical protein VMV83_15700 [Rectinemataceae bacterium]|nr:hypothetical protein [Rectinemataceae bacterium]